MFFRKKIKTDFKNFVIEIDSRRSDILPLLGLKETDFSTVPHTQLMENPGDIASGVISVKTKFNVKIFDLFDTLFIKQHDNGDIKYIFFATTQDVEKILNIRDTIVEKFGIGIYDSDQHTSIHDQEKIKTLSRGQFNSENDDVVTVWTLDHITILLQYRTDPLRQFSLFVTVKGVHEIDRSSRRNGTIADLLQTDLSLLLSSAEDDRQVTQQEGAFHCVDYRYHLTEPEFSIFDTVTIRQFSEQKDRSFKAGTNLTFTVSGNPEPAEMVLAVETLVKMYGSDDSGYHSVEAHEWHMLEDRRHWTGRMWNFNEVHGLQNLENNSETFSYSVWIDYNGSEEGFTLSVLGYNRLLDMFKAE